MDRISTETAGENINGPGKRGFRDENLPAGVQATRCDALFFNNIQEEIMAIIEDAGISPDSSQQAQLLAALDSKIAASIGESLTAGISMARTRPGSARPDFIRPSGARNIAQILASESLPLVLAARGTVNTITEQVELTGLPASQDNESAQMAWPTLTTMDEVSGEVGYVADAAIPHGEIPLGTITGSEIGNRVGKLAAFKLGSEYIFAKIKSSNRLSNVRRRYFLNSSGAPPSRREIFTGAVRNVQLALMELLAVTRDLTNNEFVVTPTARMTEADAAPGSQRLDDLWYNTATGQWNRFRNGAWEPIHLVVCGYLVMEGTSCVASRSLDIAQPYSNANNLEIELEGNTPALQNAHAAVSVYGQVKNFRFGATWPTAGLTPSGKFYLKITRDGSRQITNVPPMYFPELRGWYGPHDSDRYVAEFTTDSRSIFSDADSIFPWQRYHIHGLIPLSDNAVFPGNETVNSRVAFDSPLFANRTKRATGEYHVRLRNGLNVADFSAVASGAAASTASIVAGLNPGNFFNILSKNITSTSPGQDTDFSLAIAFTSQSAMGRQFAIWNRLKG